MDDVASRKDSLLSDRRKHSFCGNIHPAGLLCPTEKGKTRLLYSKEIFRELKTGRSIHWLVSPATQTVDIGHTSES